MRTETPTDARSLAAAAFVKRRHKSPQAVKALALSLDAHDRAIGGGQSREEARQAAFEHYPGTLDGDAIDDAIDAYERAKERDAALAEVRALVEERASLLVTLAHAKACVEGRKVPGWHAELRGEDCPVCTTILGKRSACALLRTRGEESTAEEEARAREACGLYHRPAEYPGLYEAEAERWIAIVRWCDKSREPAQLAALPRCVACVFGGGFCPEHRHLAPR